MKFVNVLWSDRSFGGAEIYTQKLDHEFSSTTIALRGISFTDMFSLFVGIINKHNIYIFHDLRASLLNLLSLSRDNICVIHGPGKYPIITCSMIFFLSYITRNVILVSDSLKSRFFNSRVKVVNNFSSSGITAKLNSKSAIYFGRIERSKNLGKMISFWVSRNNNEDLHIVGGGSILEELQKEFKNFRNIHFYGPLNHSEIKKIANQCRYYISFSDREGLSLSLLEAMSGGMIPLVAKIPSQSFLHSELGLPDAAGNQIDLLSAIDDLDSLDLNFIEKISDSVKHLCKSKFEKKWHCFWKDILSVN